MNTFSMPLSDCIVNLTKPDLTFNILRRGEGPELLFAGDEAHLLRPNGGDRS